MTEDLSFLLLLELKVLVEAVKMDALMIQRGIQLIKNWLIKVWLLKLSSLTKSEMFI